MLPVARATRATRALLPRGFHIRDSNTYLTLRLMPCFGEKPFKASTPIVKQMPPRYDAVGPRPG